MPNTKDHEWSYHEWNYQMKIRTIQIGGSLPTGSWISPGRSGGEIVQDPYHDPSSLVCAQAVYDIREGQDGHELPRVAKSFANPPYSGTNPRLACRAFFRDWNLGCTEQMMLIPASLGAKYWAEYVWSTDPLVAFLGRVKFVAGVTMPIYATRDGGKVLGYHPAGQVAKGPRTDVVLVYSGRHREIFSNACSDFPVLTRYYKPSFA